MNSFRQHYLTRVFSLLTGLVFLNMSFFLAEVSLLSLTNPEIIENVAKLISSSGFEEERDGETSGNDSSAKEVDLLFHQIQFHHSALFLITEKINRILEDHYPHEDYSLIFSPPPDPVFFS
jgi:hypothetical protein